MSEHKSMADQNETPEDVATLYSWANLHGAKYRDFSASRAEAREEARLRVETARAVEQRRLDEEAERKAQEEAQTAARLAAEAAEAAREAEAERLAEIARQAEAERQAVLAAQEAHRQAIQQRGWQPTIADVSGLDFAGNDFSVGDGNLSQFEDLAVAPEGFVGSSIGPTGADLAYSNDEVRDDQFLAQPQWTMAPQGNSGQNNVTADSMMRPFLQSQALASESYASQQIEPGQDGERQRSSFRSAKSPVPEPRDAANFLEPGQAAPSFLSSASLPNSPGQNSLGSLNQTGPSWQPGIGYPLSSKETPARPESYGGVRTGNSESSSQGSRYQPEPFHAPNYHSPETAAYPFRGSVGQNPDFDSSIYQTEQIQQNQFTQQYEPASGAKPLPSPAPWRSTAGGDYAEPVRRPLPASPASEFSPWRTPAVHESQREPVARPAWLAPEPSPQPFAGGPTRPTAPASPAAPMQAQYSAGTSPYPVSAVGRSTEAWSPAPMPHVSNPRPAGTVSNQPAGYASTPAQPLVSTGSQFERRSASPVAGQTSQRNQDAARVHNVTRGHDALNGEGSLAESRDRIANRWYALKNVFDPQAAQAEQSPIQPPARVPALAVFSLAGGVGKTSIVAALGRALSSRGERVLLVDTSTYGLLPFFFGARDQRPGLLRTFNPPGISVEAPVQLVTLDPEGNAPDLAAGQGNGRFSDGNQDWLTQEITGYARGASRMLIDLPTASGATTRRILKLAPVVLVPVVPDMSSVVSVGAIESFFRNGVGAQTPSAHNPGGQPIMPFYVLNHFDYSLPLHLDVREILHDQIGDRLLPFALRQTAAVSEALAEGMTVMDYAPTANVAEDYASLAGWVRGLSAPANVGHRGVRWSER